VGTSAARTASIRWPDSLIDYFQPQQKPGRVQERYNRFWSNQSFQASRGSALERKLEEDLRFPPLAEWLSAVERRIKNSTIPSEFKMQYTQEWLKEDVADAALRFFRNAADILPSEPFIYSSVDGDLVAEFSGTSGTLSAMISPKFVIVFAASGGATREHTFPGTATREELRKGVAEVTKLFDSGRHGSVGTSK
jgi:hypothetical protein